MVLSVKQKPTSGAPVMYHALPSAAVRGVDEMDMILALRELTGYHFSCLLLLQELSGDMV